MPVLSLRSIIYLLYYLYLYLYLHIFCQRLSSIRPAYSHIQTYKSYYSTRHTHQRLLGVNHMQSWPTFCNEFQYDLVSLRINNKSSKKHCHFAEVFSEYEPQTWINSIKPIYIMCLCTVSLSVIYLSVNAHYLAINWDFISQTKLCASVCIFADSWQSMNAIYV